MQRPTVPKGSNSRPPITMMRWASEEKSSGTPHSFLSGSKSRRHTLICTGIYTFLFTKGGTLRPLLSLVIPLGGASRMKPSDAYPSGLWCFDGKRKQYNGVFISITVIRGVHQYFPQQRGLGTRTLRRIDGVFYFWDSKTPRQAAAAAVSSMVSGMEGSSPMACPQVFVGFLSGKQGTYSII